MPRHTMDPAWCLDCGRYAFFCECWERILHLQPHMLLQMYLINKKTLKRLKESQNSENLKSNTEGS